jgi:nicotinamide-nucleotide amidase
MNIKLKVLSREINRLMWNTDKTISTAESCSSGRLATLLTEYPGSSDFFKGGIVAYADECKEQLLGVSKELIEQKSAVSEDVAREMVKGAIKLFGTDYAVAMTGFAGPGGGTEDEPIGSIWIAVGSADEIITYHQVGNEGREENVINATHKALSMLRNFLNEDLGKE